MEAEGSQEAHNTEYDSLDEALMETFPASDPIAVEAVKPLEPETFAKRPDEATG